MSSGSQVNAQRKFKRQNMHFYQQTGADTFSDVCCIVSGNKMIDTNMYLDIRTLCKRMKTAQLAHRNQQKIKVSIYRSSSLTADLVRVEASGHPVDPAGRGPAGPLELTRKQQPQLETHAIHPSENPLSSPSDRSQERWESLRLLRPSLAACRLCLWTRLSYLDQTDVFFPSSRPLPPPCSGYFCSFVLRKRENRSSSGSISSFQDPQQQNGNSINSLLTPGVTLWKDN